MKCVVPSQNVKILARAFHSLSKIGEEMFIEPMKEEVVFKTVNMAQSAFAEFKMNQSFCSSFNFSDPEDCNCLSKVTMRSCINVFKNFHNLDKQVETCEIRMKPDATVVIFQLKFTNAPVKKYYLPIIESEKLDASIPTEVLNRLTASSKMLMSTIKNFRYSEDEITVTVEQDKTYIRNHIEKKDVHCMRTELCFHPSEFETYSVSKPVCVTFCFKELRAVLSFAEPSNLSICMAISSPGKPVLFQVPNPPAYEANYVVSTLVGNAVNEAMSVNMTRHSKVGNQIQHFESSNNTSQEQDPFRFINNPSTSRSIQENPVSENSLPQISATICSSETPKIECREDRGLLNNDKSTNVRNVSKRKYSDVDRVSMSDGIESVYSDAMHSNTFRENANISTLEKNHRSEEVVGSDKKVEIIKIVFARCFRKINFIETVPGNDVILAGVSDTESV